jgi:RND family efflux transporter MFP subunit
MVDVGDRVDEGDTIAVLDTQTLLLSRELDASRLSEAEAKLTTEQAELGLANQTLRRFERLQDTNSASRSQYEDARQNVVIAAGNIAEAEAAVRSARAAVQLADKRLSYAEIKAPYAGVITQRLTETGAYVQIGEDLVRMVADRALEIEVDVPFRRVGGLAPGVQVSVMLDDRSEHVAAVRALVPEENRLTRTRQVRLVPTFGPTLNPIATGQTVTVNVPLGASRDVLSVHKDAINKNGDQDLVYIVENEVATPRSVTLGEAVGNRFEVLSGLKEGELVVVRGNERLQPNDKVRIDETPS